MSHGFIKKCLAIFVVSNTLIAPFALSQDKKPTATVDKKGENKDLKVVIKTTLGDIEAKLFYKEVPNTVANFVTLARKRMTPENRNFYDGIIFHRVIPKFMIQTGDPTGTGRGGPGYRFKDEFKPELTHSEAGMLSMANSGPNTNGSQFFITVAPTPHLDHRHSVFGKVTKGLDVAIKISEVPTEATKPIKPIKMEKVEIVGDWYKPSDFEKVQEVSEEEIKKMTDDVAKQLLSKSSEALKLGALKSHKFEGSRSQDAMIMAEYSAEFANAKTTRLAIIGKRADKAFEVTQYQFSRQ